MKTAISASLFAALLLVVTFLPAQEYSFHTFVGSDGLSNLSIQKIYQDRTGFIWVSTENGIFRYNGDRFESFGPAQGIPVLGSADFGEAGDGSLLVGAAAGLYRLNGHRFEKLAVPFKAVNWTQGIQSDTHGHTYLSTDSGLFEMTSVSQPATFFFRRLYPAANAPAEAIHAIFLDGETIWFGCGTALCSLQHEQLKTFGPDFGLLNVPIAAILKDHDGNLWLRARNEGVLEWPIGEPHVRRPDTPTPGRALTGTPALDSNGHILLGTSDGLLIQKEKGWQLIDHRVGLRGGVFDALEDRQHSLWMGTGGRGLSQWHGYREWENYSSVSGLPTDTIFESLPQSDGSIWVGTEAGLVHGQPSNNGYIWTTIAGTSGIAIHSLQQTTAGDLWLGTASKGIALLHAHTNHLDWFSAQQGLTGIRAFTIRLDHNQNLWAATDTGFFTSQPPYRTFTRIAELPSTWFWTVAIGPDNTIWAGGIDGLFTLSANHWQHWTQANGLTNKSVTAIAIAPDNSAYIGYEHGGGIDRVHLSPTGITVQNHLQRNGTDGLIYFLNFDHSGNLWVGTEHGLDTWNGTHWSHIDTTGGLVWDDCDLGGFAVAPDNTFWFGTAGGLSHFKPRQEQSVPPPEVVFTSLRIGKTEILDQQNPTLPSTANTLTASFSAPNAPHDSSLLFRYHLAGTRSAWTETTQQQLELAQIAPGKYNLEVEVRDRYGVWSDRSASFFFSVKAPWYRRAWFSTLLLLLPFLCAIIVLRIRSASAITRELRLQHLVDKRTDDLQKANDELLRLTMLDPLTGVANRRHFDQRLTEECARVRRAGGTLSLILIDVDHFKALNDSAGHQKGDEYLVLLGREFTAAVRRMTDLVARIGGEEFAFILPSTSASEAAQMAEALRIRIENLHLPHPASSSLTISAGVATTTPTGNFTPEELITTADRALYRAKNLGRNRVQTT